MPVATDTLLLFTLAAVLMNLAPGPSNLYVLARALAAGFRGGLVAALGLAAGSLVHVVAAAFGVAAVLALVPAAFDSLRLVGAAWLLWLAWQTLGAAPKASTASAATVLNLPLAAAQGPPGGTVPGSEPRAWRVFWESALVEITNPKTALFFLAFLPQFVDLTGAAASAQLLLLGLVVTVTALPCDLLVAAMGSRAGHWLQRSRRAQQIQKWLTGTILGGLGSVVLADLALDRGSE